jgi:hypothetical protein
MQMKLEGRDPSATLENSRTISKIAPPVQILDALLSVRLSFSLAKNYIAEYSLPEF